MGPNFTKEELFAWINACTSVDTLRQLHHTATARQQDLRAALSGQQQEGKEQAAHLIRPHVLVSD